MNSTLIEAKLAPATIEKDGGKEYLVRERLVQFILDACDQMDASLAKIPQLIAQSGLEAYNTEPLQRDILESGGAALWVAVYEKTLKTAEKSMGLMPRLSRQYANRNADEAAPKALQEQFDNIVSEIRVINHDLYEANDGQTVDLTGLWARGGKLRIPPRYREAVRPRFTMEIPSRDRKRLKAMRDAADTLADLKKDGVDIGIVVRMANGVEFEDAELLGVFQGLRLTR